MSADFWAGYLSGAVGVLIGNPLDLLKVRQQTASLSADPHNHLNRSLAAQLGGLSSLIRGSSAPILGYGALNALLFVSYNRTLLLLDPSIHNPINPYNARLSRIWLAGAAAGLATWIVSAPTELVKCRAQASYECLSSWDISKNTWRRNGLRGFYFGGGVTSVRDSVGYAFYFWSYELCKRSLSGDDDSQRQAPLKVLLYGGFAGMVTWVSIFPLDVVKTRMQTQTIPIVAVEQQALLGAPQQKIHIDGKRLDAFAIAKQAYRSEGIGVFFRGIGVCI